MSIQTKENQMKSVMVDGIEYVPANKTPGTRAIVVVDRGWIFAGDVTRENGRIRLSKALHVFKWESVGFAGIIENTEKADLRPIADVDIPEGAEIFCVPVPDKWGL
jgi:hypothetical protein